MASVNPICEPKWLMSANNLSVKVFYVALSNVSAFRTTHDSNRSGVVIKSPVRQKLQAPMVVGTSFTRRWH